MLYQPRNQISGEIKFWISASLSNSIFLLRICYSSYEIEDYLKMSFNFNMLKTSLKLNPIYENLMCRKHSSSIFKESKKTFSSNRAGGRRTAMRNLSLKYIWNCFSSSGNLFIWHFRKRSNNLLARFFNFYFMSKRG